MIKIISAFIAGAFFGVAVICCLMAAKDADEQMEQNEQLEQREQAEQISQEQSEDTDAKNSGQ